MRRKRLLITLLLAASASFLWAVAPALSTQRYVPAGDDFTQALPQARQLAAPARGAERKAHLHGYGAEGRVAYRTPPMTAPHRFDFVGVEGEMHALEFRARSAGEPWSDWVETDNGDPVYTGGAEQVQVRSRGVAIEGRLHYINVSGDATKASGVLTALRSTVNSAVISVLDAPDATAASPRPAFIKRREWGANRKRGGCRPRTDPERGKVKAGVIHHTVSTNTYTEAQAPSIVLGICRYHRNSNGWNDIGYNALVDRFGNIYEGRAGGLARPIVGAQVEGFNSQTAGVAMIADHQVKRATPAEIAGIVDYLSWRLGKVGVDAVGRTRLLSAGGSSNRTPAGKRIRVPEVLGHRDLGFTECPGDAFYIRIGAVRRLIQERIARSGGEDPVDPDIPPSGGGQDPGRKGSKGKGKGAKKGGGRGGRGGSGGSSPRR